MSGFAGMAAFADEPSGSGSNDNMGDKSGDASLWVFVELGL